MDSDKAAQEIDTTTMTPEQRLTWLRSRGIEVETAEDRKQQQQRSVGVSAHDPSGGDGDKFTCVMVPADDSRPFRELTMIRGSDESGAGVRKDLLPDRLKPFFRSRGSKSPDDGDDDDVDISLLRGRFESGQLLGTEGTPTEISDESIRKVASTGSVEVFSLTRPCETSLGRGVNIYLDEAGMLKRLPLNSRATQLAERAGFSPPPQFYGDVFLGRIRGRSDGSQENEGFDKTEDMAPDAKWLLNAVRENVERQMQENAATGRQDFQPAADGTEGKAKVERKGFTWIQEEDEVELTVPLPDVGEAPATKRDVKVVYRSQSVSIKLRGVEVLNLELFAPVDVDGCTWTMDQRSDGHDSKIVVTCEKLNATTWPRISR